MLGAAIAAGASLIGGLFGRSDAKKQARKEEKAIRAANEAAKATADLMNRQVRARADAAALVPVATERESVSAGGMDMTRFLADAEKGGFNPLTYLRSGAASLYATQETADWSCTTGERAMDAALAGQHMPNLQPVISQTRVPGVGEVLGNALTTGANQFLSDLSVKQNNEFQMQLLNRQLAGANSAGAYSGSRSGYVPAAFLHGSVRKTSGPQVAGGNKTLNWGTTPKAPFEPITEFDDAVASVDQVTTLFRDAWNRDPYVQWWRGKGSFPQTPFVKGVNEILYGVPAGNQNKRIVRPLPHPGQSRLGPGERY